MKYLLFFSGLALCTLGVYFVVRDLSNESRPFEAFVLYAAMAWLIGWVLFYLYQIAKLWYEAKEHE